MAMSNMSISACLKPSSSPPSPPLPKPRLLPPGSLATRSEEAAPAISWQTRLVSAAACVIIGTTAAAELAGDGGVAAAADGLRLAVAAADHGRPARWSDRRRCPPWHVNSLENIVPENLPRPSAGSRSHGGAASHRNAPAVGRAASRLDYGVGSCFSL